MTPKQAAKTVADAIAAAVADPPYTIDYDSVYRSADFINGVAAKAVGTISDESFSVTRDDAEIVFNAMASLVHEDEMHAEDAVFCGRLLDRYPQLEKSWGYLRMPEYF